MSVLNVTNLSHGFGDRAIFENVSFRLLKGEHVGLIGANGEGKSTFMNIITGKLVPDEGKVEWSRNVRVGYLDQHVSLQEGMTIRDVLKTAFQYLFDMEAKINDLYMKMAEVDPEEMDALLEEVGVLQDILSNNDFYVIDAKVEEVAKGLGLQDIGLDRDVTELSGGQRSKVLLAKLLLEKPDILLLDEPLSNLDARLRLETREEIRRIQQETGITTIFVTHDQEEAMSITDAIVLMKDGVLQQKEAPQEMYRKPANQFVASFMGTPPMSFMNGRIENGKVMVGGSVLGDATGLNNTDAIVGVRPESWRLAQENGVDATVVMVEVIGRDKLMTVTIDGQKVRCLIDSENEVNVSDIVKLTVKQQNIHLFDATNGHRLA